ncbi:MAG: EamA family transporter [Paracoccaceae bacterium]
MLALGLGLLAALVWAVHDLLARKLSQGAALVPMVLVVLGSGVAALLAPAAALGDWSALTVAGAGLATAGGACFAVAIGALYRAFSLAPARIVSPIIGAYPVLSLVLAVAQGRAVTVWDWIAVAAVVSGIAIVTLSGEPDSQAPSPLPAMGWSLLSACAFAGTFALGQEAARQGSEMPTILITRVAATALFLALFLARGPRLAALRGNLWVLAAMGAFDALALGLVTASGSLPRAEYATVASSLFGVGTILLAAHFLRERLRAHQWLGVVVVFTGIGILSAQG